MFELKRANIVRATDSPFWARLARATPSQGPEPTSFGVIEGLIGDARVALIVDYRWLQFANEIESSEQRGLLDGMMVPDEAIVALLDGWPSKENDMIDLVAHRQRWSSRLCRRQVNRSGS